MIEIQCQCEFDNEHLFTDESFLFAKGTTVVYAFTKPCKHCIEIAEKIQKDISSRYAGKPATNAIFCMLESEIKRVEHDIIADCRLTYPRHIAFGLLAKYRSQVAGVLAR